MNRKSIQTLLILIVCLFAVIGCASKQNETITGNTIRLPLLDKNCTLPCWLGIQVGITKFDNARQILQEHYGANSVTVGKSNLSWSVEKKEGDGVRQGNIFFVEGLVSEILLTFDDKAGFEVQDLLGIFGEPKWAVVSWGGPIKPDLPCLGVSLHFPSEGIIAILDTKESFKGVSKTQLVSLLRIVSTSKNDKWQIYDALRVEWNGYQDYCQTATTVTPYP